MKHPVSPLRRIVSGGQTGVDRAALDTALELGVPCTGWVPSGRLAEDGPLPARYPLRETPTRRYEERTMWNVRDSDGTLILSRGPLSGGTALTLVHAKKMSRPYLVVDLLALAPRTQAVDWVFSHRIGTLNIAGPRESMSPGIYAAALAWLRPFLGKLRRPATPV